MPGTCAAAVCSSVHTADYQGSLTAGTILSRTRTDLRKWLLAIWLLASTKKAPSAAELSRQLGVTAKTAWLLRARSPMRWLAARAISCCVASSS